MPRAAHLTSTKSQVCTYSVHTCVIVGGVAGVLVLALVLAGVASARAARAITTPVVAPPAYGVSTNGLFDRKGHFERKGKGHLGEIRAEGIEEGRSDATWWWIEPKGPVGGAHHYVWDRHDRIVRSMALNGLRWLPVLGYATRWSSTVKGTSYGAPRHAADYAAYAGAVAARYGSRGTFWNENPTVPRLPVRAYEVWNEPNWEHFWRPAPNAARYAELLVAAAVAIRTADPAATVVSGGLASPQSPTTFVRAMLAAQPSIPAVVDAVGYHPYARSGRATIALVRGMRRALDGAGASAMGIAVTEVGWTQRASGRPESLPESSRAGAYALMTDALARGNCRVDRVVPFMWTRIGAVPQGDDWYAIAGGDGTLLSAGAAFAAGIARSAVPVPAAGPRVPSCDRVAGTPYAPPLRLGLRLTSEAPGCVRARVTYRSHAVNDVRVAFSDGARRTSGADGEVTHCGMRRGHASASATADRVAASPRALVSVR